MELRGLLFNFQEYCWSSKLYAVGGRDGSSCLRSVECYDPHINRWTLCSPMNKRRGGVGVAVCNDFLYAVGGHDAPSSNPASSRFECVERYDFKTDAWTTVAPISFPRDAVGVCVLGDKLFAVGGYDGQQYLNNVDCYYCFGGSTLHWSSRSLCGAFTSSDLKIYLLDTDYM